MKELVERIVHALVDYPEQVEVSAVVGSTITVLELSVAREDMGKVIGKQGRTIAALRTLATAICAKYGWRAQLEIVA